ncbi:unnamed protein product [Rhodiola kirilowii]
MDFITHLPKSRGKSVIMVVIDRLSKYAHFCSLPDGFSAESVAQTFIQEVCHLHGIPTTIVSDRDPVFMSMFWQELFRKQGTVLSHSSSYHPQSDGQTEVINRILEDYLQAYVSGRQADWVPMLPWVEYHYNTATHSGLRTSPSEAVYGRPPPTLTDYEPGDSKVASVDNLLATRAALIAQLRNNLLQAQQRMTIQANKHHTAVDYIIIAKVGQITYKLALLADSRVHTVFHASILKKCRAAPPFQHVDWPKLFVDNCPVLLPEKILGHRLINKGAMKFRKSSSNGRRMISQMPRGKMRNNSEQSTPTLTSRTRFSRGRGAMIRCKQAMQMTKR